MLHETPLITTIVAGLVLAFIFGSIANRFRLPPLVGYMVAGVLVGPYTPGFVADQTLALELAEIGVILLMFGVGLHFSLKDLMSVRALAIPGALVQIAGATVLGLLLGVVLGWGIAGGLVFGLALSVASTVVLLKALQDRRLVETERGRLAVGWLIVEDLAMVLALVLIPALATTVSGEAATAAHDPFVSLVERLLNSDIGVVGVILLTIVKVAAFVGFMLIVGRRVIPWMLHAVAHSGSRELFRLAVLAIALGVAFGAAYLFGVSLALGAFFAGMILSESELSHRAAQETLPLRDAFAVLFFVSVGMLFDPTIILRDPLLLLATLFIILIGKSVAAFAIVIAFKRPLATALLISVSLAQIGEFSFILAGMGVSLGILPTEGQDLILAGAIISIILNPLMFWLGDRVRPMLEARLSGRLAPAAPAPIEPTLEPSLEGTLAAAAPEPLPVAVNDDDETVVHATVQHDHTVLVGFGRVGSVVGERLREAGRALVVVEDADERIAAARNLGIEVIVGNAAAADVLKLANVVGASSMVIAIPNAFEAGQTTEQSRRLNPHLRIVARAHSDDEVDYLSRLGADAVVMGEREIGLGMLALIPAQPHDGSLPANGNASGPTPVPAEAPLRRLAPVENILAAASQPAEEAGVAVVGAAGMVAGAAVAEAAAEPAAIVTPDAVVIEATSASAAIAGSWVAPARQPAASEVAVAAPVVPVEPVRVEPEIVAPRSANAPDGIDWEPETRMNETSDAGMDAGEIKAAVAAAPLPGTYSHEEPESPVAAAEPGVPAAPGEDLPSQPGAPVEEPGPDLPDPTPEPPGVPIPPEPPARPDLPPELPGIPPIEEPTPTPPPTEIPDPSPGIEDPQPFDTPAQPPMPDEIPIGDPQPDDFPADPSRPGGPTVA